MGLYTDENGLRVEREFINTIAYGVSCGVEFNSMAGLEAVGKVVRIEEALRISLPGQKLGGHNNHF